ncbi:uncharacterized protein LOC124496600 [Dermatophagoides farinae]|uniref:Uncharacterized protein n=1 Tax=Dermatophagoides farinae TaxID=6954 RepID=A0A922L0M4_DERFA|nr:uncharacterized protein LOC124496600 [Dermatophagoides farinae]KAH7637545.1 hypothetical protein HUG17_8649 [Dermatophagoides farinae]KAH9501976.1 hypothetical protein DERF_012779 [Dermatophagoides farinae]
MSIRGNIKKVLFPHIVKHIVISLCGASIFFIGYLMFDLISTLVDEIQNSPSNSSNMHDGGHKSDDPMTTGKVLYYFRNFFMLMLFALMQLFGLVGALKQNRNILSTFICCLMVAFVMMVIDYLTNTGYLSLGIFFLIQASFAYLLMILNQYRGHQISNIHYIPMPDEDVGSIGHRPSIVSSDSMRF